MAMTVIIRTENTKTEKQRLLMSLIRCCPMGSVVGSESFMGFSQNPRSGFEADLQIESTIRPKGGRNGEINSERMKRRREKWKNGFRFTWRNGEETVGALRESKFWRDLEVILLLWSLLQILSLKLLDLFYFILIISQEMFVCFLFSLYIININYERDLIKILYSSLYFLFLLFWAVLLKCLFYSL